MESIVFRSGMSKTQEFKPKRMGTRICYISQSGEGVSISKLYRERALFAQITVINQR